MTIMPVVFLAPLNNLLCLKAVKHLHSAWKAEKVRLEEKKEEDN